MPVDYSDAGKVKAVVAAAALELGLKPELLMSALRAAALRYEKSEVGTCRLCGKTITYEDEYKDKLVFYKEHPGWCYRSKRRRDGIYEEIRMSPQEAAKRAANLCLHSKKTCCQCQGLTAKMRHGSGPLSRFLGGLKLASAVSESEN